MDTKMHDACVGTPLLMRHTSVWLETTERFHAYLLSTTGKPDFANHDCLWVSVLCWLHTLVNLSSRAMYLDSIVRQDHSCEKLLGKRKKQIWGSNSKRLNDPEVYDITST